MNKREKLKQAKRVEIVAAMFGHNELAKAATSLGDKVWHRLRIQTLEERLKELGGTIDITRDPVILTLPGHPINVSFTEDDIELMRQVVREHDAKKAATP